MTWDKYDGSTNFVGNVPVDMNSPPAVGETARLTRDGYEFDVEIKGISGVDLSGVVTGIGREPAVEAAGIKRGDAVRFHANHIRTLYRV